MRSGTSFFDLTIYRKTVTRFWPLWAVNLVIWLFILPFNGLMTLGDYLDGGRTGNSMLRFARNVGDYAIEWGVVFALLAGLIVAMAVCSHMYNNRSANFMGALPARREGQFLSTYLAGLTMLIAPNLVIFLLTLLVEAAAGTVMWLPLLFWLAALSGMEFFFYSFAVCLGQFTGHILALPVYYGIFNAIVLAVYSLLNWVMHVYYYGFYGMDISPGGLIYWCTPVLALLEMDIDVLEENGVWITDIEGLWTVGVYAVVAVVLTVCALLLYRRRNLETAGDIVAVKAMRPVFKYGVAACAGLFLGFLTEELLGGGELLLMIAVILWGVIGYFVAQMLLDKTIRVFRKWKGAVAVTGAFLVLFAMISFDLTGYETRVPAANDVYSVSIRGLQSYPYDSGSSLYVTLTDPEGIADVVALHEAVVKFGEDGEPSEDGQYNWNSIRMTYTLKSGRLISRSYYVAMGKELTALAEDLLNDNEVRRKAYELDVVEEWQAQGARLEVATVRSGDYEQETVECWGEEARVLWDAVMADFEAGNIGLRVLQDASEKTSGDYFIQIGDRIYTDCKLEFRWAMSIQGDEGPDSTALRMDDVEYAYTSNMKYWYMQITVMEQSSNTLAALEQLLPQRTFNPEWEG